MLDRRRFVLSVPAILVAGPAHADSRRSAAIVSAEALPLINSLREEAGLDALIIDPVMERVALDWSKEMALLGKISHRNFKSRMRKAGVVKPSAENVASGQATVREAIASWNGSSDHRDNMLGIYNRMGMAGARNTNSDNRTFWTLVLSV